ncbi:polyphosphate kinase 1 [Candidatus Soleaferrea massiliensis]|uniref:polyphosphate kinase 1 n=1 Tax=Candidatus Soleaferrea massiliensis TaxID=1470354 RepID=UPI001FA71C12|nr:polyphosphate kinase 1 [Candidatus Soleaferrea massiliensis]
MNSDLQCMQNRELSWLKFNERVLEEANCEETPLYERLKFISIFTTNLDEFYMVRVGSLTDLALMEPDEIDNKSGMTPIEQLEAIYEATVPLYALRDRALGDIEEKLQKHGIQQMRPSELTTFEQHYAERYFEEEVMPLLSPQIIDVRHPFPHLENKQLNIAVLLRHKGRTLFGIIPVNPALKRIIQIPQDSLRYMLVEDLILSYAAKVFDMYEVVESTIMCVTRNADINTDEGFFDEDMDYRQHMRKVIKKRERLAPVRLEIQSMISDEFSDYLCRRLNIKKRQIFVSRIPLDMSFIFSFQDSLPPALKQTLLNKPFTPQASAGVNPHESMTRQVLRKDIFLSYPFESMTPFLNLIKEAASDAAVVSIKITLYRIARQSKLAEYLITAAENGKEVTVLMELRARFDEQNNIEWAQRLEEAGCRVIYGLDGFKVHSKICLITRRERTKIQYITQIATGNYNESTAKLYTDLSLLTSNQEIGEDAVSFFKNLALGNLNGQYRHLRVSPSSLKPMIMTMVDREIRKAKSGEEGSIFMKMNSLTDKGVIEKLIEASMAGVRVQLIIRGICCLIPQVPGRTENITVISIVGRFLEHSRIYCFGKGADRKLYISSADMMTRNTERRVEIACPVLDQKIADRIMQMIDIQLHDNVKAREQSSDGRYTLRQSSGGQRVNSQEYFMEEAIRNAALVPAAPPKKHSLLRRLFQKKG